MRPQARISDMHTCTVIPGAYVPIVGPCAFNVLVNFLPAARAGVDMTMNMPPPPAVPSPHPFPMGSATVFINYMPALRVGDTCALGGPITFGAANVFTGG